MKKRLWLGLLMALSAPACVAAQSAFDGTWKIDLTGARFSAKPDVYLLQSGLWQCKSCVPPINLKADGRDYKVGNEDPCVETSSVKVLDDRTIEIIDRKSGKITKTSKGAVSLDGNTLTFEESDECNAQSERMTSELEETRVAAGPVGSHAISGSWRMIKASASQNALEETLKVVGDTVSYSDTAGESFTAKLDGTYTPTIGDPYHSKVSVKREGKDTLMETIKQNGKVIEIQRMTVEPDGKTMTITFRSTQSGVDTVVAKKQ
jgi:hypothetical protein